MGYGYVMLPYVLPRCQFRDIYAVLIFDAYFDDAAAID